MLTTIAAGRVYNFSHAVGRNQQTGTGFHWPTALALGPDGVVYVVSRGNETNFGTRVSKLTLWPPGEEELICEFGTYGEMDGQLIWPTSLTLDMEGNLYVSDEWLNRISIFDQDGTFLEKWGTSGTSIGGLNGPSGLALDKEENLYVVDSFSNRVQKFTKDGTFLAKFGEEGSGEGQFDMPWGITIDNKGDVYVGDWKNHRVQKFSSEGTFLTSFGTFGTGVGELNHPTDVAVDDEGDVYVCDWDNDRVQIFAPDGDVITSLIGDAQQLSKWGKEKLDVNPDIVMARRRLKSLEPEWRFCHPSGVAFDQTENRIVVVDCQRSRLQIYIKDKDYVDPQFNL